MNRREALNMVALLMGGTVVGGTAFLEGCKTADKKSVAALPLTKEQIAFLDEVAETILPTTSTPGAKAAKVGEFMNTMVVDCYEEKDQKVFLEGLSKIDEGAQAAFKKDFMQITPEQRKELLSKTETEAVAYAKNKKPEDPAHYFSLMKQLTLLGYFSSEVGATQALRYVPIPGKYEGCIDYKKGDKAWAL
jgi:hypothetical protein